MRNRKERRLFAGWLLRVGLGTLRARTVHLHCLRVSNWSGVPCISLALACHTHTHTHARTHARARETQGTPDQLETRRQCKCTVRTKNIFNQ
jgi:hypothetical protein